MEHAARGRNEPYERKENGDRGDNDGVNLAGQWSNLKFIVTMKEICREPKDNGTGDKFAKAQEDRDCP